MFLYILLAVALIIFTLVIYDKNVNDRSFSGKIIDEDVPEDRNSIKPFRF